MKIEYILSKIKQASVDLSQKKNTDRNRFLKYLSSLLWNHREKIIIANRKDINFAKKKKFSNAFIDRLKLDEAGIREIISRLRSLQKFDSPIGKVIALKKLNSGLILRKISVPLGVILVIYESRPEVTIDVAALCIKSGNCAILKGGSEALNTNRILYQCILQALKAVNIGQEVITFISNKKKSVISRFLKQNQFIDLVIARGGYEMVEKVQTISKIPVLAHSAGGARIYVDKSANLEIAEKIIINAKISKPAACNSVDTILVHKDIVGKFLPPLVTKLKASGVEVRGEGNWEMEFLDLIIAIKIVKNIDEAIKFINKYSKHHTEGVIAKERGVIDKFVNFIDAAAIFINSSTRLHDGGVFGMGGEIGSATGKLHARGPVGLSELTTYKWIVEGDGQIRE